MEIDNLYSKAEHEEGAELQVRDKAGKLTDFWIKLAGPDSDRWRNIEHAQRVKDLSAAASGDKAEPRTAAQLIAAVTLDWRGLTANGEVVPFSEKAAVDLYTNAPYICDQADRFFSNRANFIKPLKES